jgi:hypothetical protein
MIYLYLPLLRALSDKLPPPEKRRRYFNPHLLKQAKLTVSAGAHAPHEHFHRSKVLRRRCIIALLGRLAGRQLRRSPAAG